MLVLSVVLLTGCTSDEEVIPSVSFSGKINLLDPTYADDSFIVKYDANHQRLGIAGIAIYRLSAIEYYAFDLMCPYEQSVQTLVEINPDNSAICTCPDCGSEFLIVNSSASIVKGPAQWPLKKYETQVTGDYLYIWN
jgi:nitrite reductase/ring-hydroxylating ferredoxin subunit